VSLSNFSAEELEAELAKRDKSKLGFFQGTKASNEFGLRGMSGDRLKCTQCGA
jgi:hypothetical protein